MVIDRIVSFFIVNMFSFENRYIRYLNVYVCWFDTLSVLVK